MSLFCSFALHRHLGWGERESVCVLCVYLHTYMHVYTYVRMYIHAYMGVCVHAGVFVCMCYMYTVDKARSGYDTVSVGIGRTSSRMWFFIH